MKRTTSIGVIACAALLTIDLSASGQEPKPAAPTTASSPAPAAHAPKRLEVAPADLKWLDRLPRDDRAALDELLGWAPPPFSGELQWVAGSAGGSGGSATTWDSLRGKVVVLQSFTTATTAGRGWPQRVANMLKDFDTRDLRIIALHTPDGAAEASAFLQKKPAPESVTVAIDPTGAFCDSLAIYKQPMNIVIDRNGAVRFAGLNNTGIEEAVKLLVAEPFNQNTIVPQRGQADRSNADDEPASAANAEFPPITGKVEYALDIRGKPAPAFSVSQWLTERPNAEGKVVLLDFWATWCGPCVASIPHMNDLASKFKADVVCVGISSETPAKFEQGMERLGKEKKITLNTFQYALALDPNQQMSKAIKITGIPHCIVMDRNWIVRWQGMPAALDAATLDKIVKANATLPGATSGKAKPPGSAKRKRWTSA
jgi:thiol-disulfide isomerase/thioredoxin